MKVDTGCGTGTEGRGLPGLRIGILGAARIAELAIVKPAHATGTRLVTVAARDRRRAEAFAAGHGVERATDSYADVLADPEVRVVYNPLPNAFHGFHYLFHPVMQRLFALLDCGELGELQRVDALHLPARGVHRGAAWRDAHADRPGRRRGHRTADRRVLPRGRTAPAAPDDPPSETTMRIGLIGLGRIGAFHAETLSTLPSVSSLVVTDAVPAARAPIPACS